MWNQGKLSEAEPLAGEALKVRRQVLGGNHPGALFSIHSPSTLLRDQGKLNKAEQLHGL